MEAEYLRLMKKLVPLFGLLDVIGLAYSFDRMTAVFKSEYIFTWINLIWLMIYFSLIISAFFLLKSSKTGLWVYYVQFPFRVLWMSGLSFGFIMLICRLFPDNQTLKKVLMILCLVLEAGRLVFTIIVHKKHYTIISPEKNIA
jgi:predicted ABC-type sugar transport system permease subunit